MKINDRIKERLNEILKESLIEYGIMLKDNGNIEPQYPLREIMKKIVLKKNGYVDISLRKYFASEKDIDVEKIKPRLIYFDSKDKLHNKIFSAATKSWSTPVSSGYGRRMRFLVWDDGNDKLIGIIGLCDPVIGLNVRDNYIGWNKETKEKRLYNVLTAYILGSVYPYNELLGAKLVALLATSKEVTDKFREKYEGRVTHIRKERKIPELVMIDTMGAFGKSSIYNKLKGWKFIGYTKGQTHYHLSTNGFYEEAEKILKEINHPIIFSYKYGNGPNWKIRVIKEVLAIIGLKEEKILTLGTKRAYYIAPLIKNWREFLNGQTDKVERTEKTSEELFEYWKKRWFPKGKKRFKKLLEKGD